MPDFSTTQKYFQKTKQGYSRTEIHLPSNFSISQAIPPEDIFLDEKPPNGIIPKICIEKVLKSMDLIYLLEIGKNISLTQLTR